MLVRILATFVLLLAHMTGSGLLAGESKTTAAIDPDFLAQGEYVGEVSKLDGKKKLGVQVIALGKGKFHAVWRNGGLPGDGWDKIESASVREKSSLASRRSRRTNRPQRSKTV